MCSGLGEPAHGAARPSFSGSGARHLGYTGESSDGGAPCRERVDISELLTVGWDLVGKFLEETPLEACPGVFTRATRNEEPARVATPRGKAADDRLGSELVDVLRYNPSGESIMSMTGLTPEQHRLVEQAGGQPVLIEDARDAPIVRSHSCRCLRAGLRCGQTAIRQRASCSGRHSKVAKEHILRDLPELLKDRRLRGKYVAYHGDERVKTGRSEIEVIRECLRRGLSDDKYDVFIIEPQSREPEEVEYPSAWYDV